jgi:uncharacterized heparinase superfamily protein
VPTLTYARDRDVTLLHKPHRAAWYLARLAAMSPAEVVWRAGRVAGFEPASPLAGARPRWNGSPWRSTLLRALEPARAELMADAERIAAGEIDLWGHQVRFDPNRVEWQVDPLDGRALAAGSGPADRKAIWELHRHQHLVPLAAAAALVDRDDWAALCLAQLESWIEANPPRDGVGWSSGYETAHRLVSWALAVPLVADRAPEQLLERITESYVEQAQFVTASPSRFSSANNHRLMELLGLLAASLLSGHNSGRDEIWGELERESALQTFLDGGSREQAAGYFLYVLEILSLAAFMAREAGAGRGSLDRTLESMLDWYASVAGVDGELPAVGDDAEDRPARLGYFSPRRASHVAARAAAVLRGEPGLIASGDVPPLRESKTLEESGYVVFRSTFEAERVRIFFDVGALGFGALAAHGHADALAIVVNVGAETLLRDSGTGSYVPGNGRAAFRATLAHNTVVVDGEDQAEQRGPHIWGRHYSAVLEAATLGPDVEYARGAHDGYERGASGAIHTRSVTLLKAPHLLIVLDRVSGSRELEASLVWNLMPGSDELRLSPRFGALAVASTPDAARREEEGRFSERYSWQAKAPRLRWIANGREVVFATVVSLGRDRPVRELGLKHSEGITRVSIGGTARTSLVEDWIRDQPVVDA